MDKLYALSLWAVKHELKIEIEPENLGSEITIERQGQGSLGGNKPYFRFRHFIPTHGEGGRAMEQKDVEAHLDSLFEKLAMMAGD